MVDDVYEEHEELHRKLLAELHADFARERVIELEWQRKILAAALAVVSCLLGAVVLIWSVLR